MNCERCGKNPKAHTEVIICGFPHTFHNLCATCVAWVKEEVERREHEREQRMLADRSTL